MNNRVFLLGGGPSLIGFDFDLLEGEDTIAVNNSIFVCPEPNYFITKDFVWLKKNCILKKERYHPNRSKFLRCSATKYFAVGLRGTGLRITGPRSCIDVRWGLEYDLSVFDEIIYTAADGGIGSTWKDFRNGGDSGFSALQLAVVLGYKEIYLLGYDFVIAGEDTHFHREYGAQHNDPLSYLSKLRGFLNWYPKALKDIKKLGVKIYSCSEISMLNRFIPYVNFEGLVGNGPINRCDPFQE